jgi:hypothetical protein
MGSYSNPISANQLAEVHMIAGDERTFTYNILDEEGNPSNLDNAICSILLFKYGDPSYLITEISGSTIDPTGSGSPSQFTITFSGSGLSGTYQQQVKIIESTGKPRKPAQGKVVIFASPD